MDIRSFLESSGAILHGHFILTSGRRSATYVEKFRLIEEPKLLSALCAEIADQFSEDGIEAVAGPLTGGIIIAFEVARQMNLPAIYVENDPDTKEKVLRRQKHIPKGLRILVVDDVLTTGKSLRETRDCLEAAGGDVVGYGVLIDRSEQPVDLGKPIFGAHQFNAESFEADEIPDFLKEIPAVKPGTSR